MLRHLQDPGGAATARNPPGTPSNNNHPSFGRSSFHSPHVVKAARRQGRLVAMREKKKPHGGKKVEILAR
ncbi:hypothetical protein SESBI_50972 [Sesbania bispinosa]|nr:hypothetical protein SESBI_50972 [Sesbania bispinosa]